MSYIMIIEGDMNDADMRARVHEIRACDIPIIKRVAKAIRNSEVRYNWDKSGYEDGPYKVYKDILSEDDIEFFNDYVPGGDYAVHRITSIRILKVQEDNELL